MISINSNQVASQAALNLYKTNSELESSLTKLSSGSRISKPSDDAGGLAVSMKMDSQERQLGALENNLTNVQSYLETQEGALRILAKILTRISELEALKKDVTKNDGDIENYDKEIENLQAEIVKIREETFNGVRLFSPNDTADSIQVDAFPLNDSVVDLVRPPLAESNTETITYTRVRESSNVGSFDTSCLTETARRYLFESDNSLINGLGSVSSSSGDATFGENVLHRNDDGSSTAIDITSVFGSGGLNFNGTNFTEIYVNNNGNITFGSLLDTFTPTSIAANDIPIIAPFWGDVDTRQIGSIGANPAPSIGGNSTGSNQVFWDLDADNKVLTVTWDDVRFYSNTSPGTNPENVTNSFQLQIIDNCDGNAIIVFRYENVDWTAGGASGGNNYGLGGTPSRAGFNNGSDALELPQSGNEDEMLDLDSSLPTVGFNSEQPGVYIFQLVNGQITPPIDETIIETVTETITTWTANITLDQVADYIAQNGASQSAIQHLAESVTITKNNLQQANSRIKDVDIAAESTRLSRFQILQQAGTSMLAQANNSQQIILKLLGL
jgi:flagellin-like hook-associated protein FlgL